MRLESGRDVLKDHTVQQEQSRTYTLRRERVAQRGSLNGVVLNRLSGWVEFMETQDRHDLCLVEFTLVCDR